MSKGTVVVDSMVLTGEGRLSLFNVLGVEWKDQFDELDDALNGRKASTPEATAAMMKRCGHLSKLQRKVARAK